MAGDYISRETALEDFESCNAENPNWTPQRVKTLLLRQPAADVAPVVHGEWIGNKGGFWEMATCSMCDEEYPCVGMAPNFCPNCGARMDGAAE